MRMQGLLRVPAVADRRVRVRVLAAGRRPRRVAGWLEDIEIVLTPNLYSFQLQVVFVMLLCEPWQPSVRART